MKKPKLSVIVSTYNHEKYIRKALDSILMQETDFDFEIVISEDCSPDDTKNIVKEYRKNYPDKVRIVHREKRTGHPTLNVYEATMMCKGEYLAYLEGDDYWTDHRKLQKQVDFLEAHPEYIAVTHSSITIDEEGNDISDNQETKDMPNTKLYEWSGVFTMDDYRHSGKYPGRFASIVSRNIYKNAKHDYTIMYKAHDFVDDGQIILFLLLEGDIYRLDDVMSAWRYVKKAGGTNWTSIAMKRNIWKEDVAMTSKLMKWIEDEYGLSDYAKVKAKKDFETSLMLFAKEPGKDSWQFVKEIFEYNIKHVVMQDKKVRLIPYCIKCVKEKYMPKG